MEKLPWTTHFVFCKVLDMSHKTLRVLSYNIHKGFSLRRKFILDSIRASIQQTGANLVFLQEVQGEHKNHAAKIINWPSENQLEFLADTVWPHFAYGKNAIYEHGHHGNGIMSQFPILMHENIDISNNRYERRGLLHATIALPNVQDIHLICVHLDLLESGRRNQTSRIISRIESHVPPEAPLVLAGDFNDWSEKATSQLKSVLHLDEVFLTQTGQHAKSYPSLFPMLPLDRIYFRHLHPKKAKCFTGNPWSKLSDHGALYAEFDFSF